MSFIKSIKELGKDMSIYGISKVLSQLIGLLLLPLYTKYLEPSDYGIFSLVGMSVAGYAILSNVGISSAIFRFTGTSNTEEDKIGYLNNAQILNIAFNLFFLLLLFFLRNPIAGLLFEDHNQINYFYFILLSGTVGSIASLMISYLRVQRKTKKIAIASLINLTFSVSFTFYLLVYLNFGVWGALIGGLLGDIAAMTFYTFYVSKINFRKIHRERIAELMRYALPMFPHKIIGFGLPVVSQLILLRYLDLSALGMYNVAYKFCLPLVLFINLFQQAYAPYRFEIYRSEHLDKSLFAKINIFYVTLILLGYTVLVLFGGYLLQLFTDSKFHSAAYFIPFLALMPLFQGIYYTFGVGVEFSKKPKFYPIISGLGFIIIIVFSLIFIPFSGIIGAAFANVAGWISMSMFIYFYSQKIYKIQYNWAVLIKLFLVSLVFNIAFIVWLNTLNIFLIVVIFLLFLMSFSVILKSYLPIIKSLNFK